MWIIWLLIFLIAIIIAAAFFIYRFAFYSPDKTQNDDYHLSDTPQMNAVKDQLILMVEELEKKSYEPVYITSTDGLKLRGRYYHNKDGAPIWIGFHGYRGTPTRDISGGSKIYLDMGHNLLLVEQRAHKSSEGHTITFGIMEKLDVEKWIEYVINRFGKDQIVMLNGISMGAATVLMASGLNLPPNVKCILADCPYSSPKDILLKVCQDMHLPPRLCWPFLWLGAKLFGHFELRDGGAVEAVKRAKVPILIIHGEDDRFVPCDMSRRIAQANPEKVELHTIPGAGHGLSFLIDQKTYISIVRKFVQRVLQQQ